jgi:membrane protease YdiL (CAAX protease family)
LEKNKTLAVPDWLRIIIVYYALTAVIFVVAFAYPVRDVNVTSPSILLSVLLLIPVYIWVRAQRGKPATSKMKPTEDKGTTLFGIFALFALALSVRIPSVLLFGEPYEKTPLILLLVLIILLVEKSTLTSFGFKTTQMGKSLVLGLAFFAVFGLVNTLLPYGLIYAFTGQLPIQSFDTPMALLALPFMTLCVGISEEGTFRGYIQTKLERHYSWATAIVSQAILFGIWHFVWDLYPFDAFAMAEYILVTFLFGLLFGYFYNKTRNLVPLVLVHGLWNSVPTAIIADRSVIAHLETFPIKSQLLVLILPYLLSFLLASLFIKYFAKRFSLHADMS